MEDEKAVAG
jgi:CRP-like cAMP-binding protein